MSFHGILGPVLGRECSEEGLSEDACILALADRIGCSVEEARDRWSTAHRDVIAHMIHPSNPDTLH